MAQYSFTKSTNEIPIKQPKLDRGDQLIYTPIHQGQLELGLTAKNGSLIFTQRFSGSYQGINGKVASYYLGSMRATHNTRVCKIDTVLFGSVQNLWNASYQVIENRPMPGINYRAGIQLQLSK